MIDPQTLTVAITGGAGNVGRALRRVLAPTLGRVIVIDIAEPPDLAANESWAGVDITDLAALTGVLRGVDGIIHLAGFPNERPLEPMLAVNVAGASTLYEAARLAGVQRVVLGSSNHVVGFYPRDERVGPDAPMRPDGLYGLSKCWAELTAGLYFDKAGIRTLIVRIGNAQGQPTTPRSLEIWISPGDLAQLMRIGLTHPEIDCTVVYGVSAGGGNWYDNAEAHRLGYQPQDRISDFAHPDAAHEPVVELPQISGHFQGGPFCSIAHDGTLRARRRPTTSGGR